MSEVVIEKMSGKLTKKFFLQIPTGLYLVSSIGWAPNRPIFEEKVLHNKNREDQWERILKCRADQRLCYIFENKKDHEKWLKQFWTEKAIHKGC
jgi:hypothetical protein